MPEDATYQRHHDEDQRRGQQQRQISLERPRLDDGGRAR